MWRLFVISIVLSTARAEVPSEDVKQSEATEAHAMGVVKLWRPSLAALAVGSALDAHSSWSKCCEANPFLPSNNGRFGGGAAAMKGAAFGGQLLFQTWAVRKWPRASKPLSIVNFATAGLLTGVAIRNYGLPGSRVRR